MVEDPMAAKSMSANIHSVIQHKPQLLMDNGADLTRTLIQHYGVEGLIGCTEETTTGANLL
ncbi:hypothetical protein GC102_09680 [Paenibacillus sp. LMG 31460]|uniref:Uncharacterized protein n=1 Tax=Paenibacillus germinis TaxID=2654979 RepID=A0ABX1YYL6_9BACL|nr:hypothetical protein [Paenibacillus germinis]NOU86043.1 hypothetical protein [Paenibacillus germinis]